MSLLMKPVDPKWSRKLASLQKRLALDNEGMARKFGVGTRTYLSWKYRERNPSKTAVKLLKIFSAG